MKKKKLSTIDITPFNQTKKIAVNEMNKDMKVEDFCFISHQLNSKKTDYLNKKLKV